MFYHGLRGAESWNFTDSVERKLNGWASRCLAKITGKSYKEEASRETQTMGPVGILNCRRLRLLGHDLRADPGLHDRQDVLRHWEQVRRGWIVDRNTLIRHAPAASSTAMLVALAGGDGTFDDRREARLRWESMCKDLLSPADRERSKRKYKRREGTMQRHTANTAEQTASVLSSTPHRYRCYTDGGADGNGRNGFWGAAHTNRRMDRRVGTKTDK